MEHCDKLFLQALKAALQNQTIDWKEEVNPEDWMALFQMAEKHRVLPMIYEAVYDCPSARRADEQLFLVVRKKTIHSVMHQALKTDEFLKLYRHLQNAGISPIVVKGLVCRNLYPKPDHRGSGDEDLWVSEEQFEVCHEALLAFGMNCAVAETDFKNMGEIPYHKENSPLYIELHKELFPRESGAYGELNDFFGEDKVRVRKLPINGVELLTMSATDHLFYLICHSFKHFLHSGFGIRQICDIIIFASVYGLEIDWHKVLEQCRELRAEQFAAALFRIGEKYLTFDSVKAYYPEEWQQMDVEELPLLEDLLCAGVYGAADKERVHSSTVTLHAVEEQKQGKNPSPRILKSIFPSAKELERRYSYLQGKPYLLPVAWTNRIVKYGKEMKESGKNTAVDSVRIGTQRVELLKKYKIID